MTDYLVIISVVAVALYIAYRAGKTKAKADVIKENANVLSKAIKARASVKSPDDARRLLMEHAVRDVSIIQDSKTDGE